MDTLKEVGRQAAARVYNTFGGPYKIADAVALAAIDHIEAQLLALSDGLTSNEEYVLRVARKSLALSPPSGSRPDIGALFAGPESPALPLAPTPREPVHAYVKDANGFIGVGGNATARYVAPTPPETAERTLASIAAMLGWGNVPPRETLEREIAALKHRASSPSPGAVDPFEQTVSDEQFMERIAKGMPEFKRDEMTFRERQLGRALLQSLRSGGSR